MNPVILITMTLSLCMGTLITTSSSHWLLAWMGLEINTFAIIPLMAQNQTPRATEAATKYFIIQVTAATLLLFASISNAWLLGQWNIQQMNHPFPLIMLYTALALKLGLAPMHAWLPEILQGLNLPTGLLLTTWQKLAPLSLVVQLPTSNYTSMVLIYMALLSILVGGWGGLNQTQLRKILGYSSIAHLGWMFLVLQYLPPLTFMAFIVYVVLTFSTFLVFWYNKTNTVNTLSTSWAKMPTITAISPLILLSLGGFPPLTGFIPKWMILLELTKQDMMLIATMAALSALLSLYFYVRLFYAMTLTMPPNNLPATLPWRVNFLSPTLPLAISTVISLCLLPLTPTTTTLLSL
uniref:NADH-ubiquinone oxidoreductase chain 2 n=1 Tax=Neofundulus paraguayensis TaxID=61827 RepID=Q9TD19_9TELE|nr:NADH dehydrogenase subunit II [Neofundulus paraguayensis]